MTGRYEISVSFDGFYSFALCVGTRVLLDGGDHSTLPLCRKGIASVRINADAPLAAMGEEAAQKCPKFCVLADGEGRFRLYLYAKNGRAIAASPPHATAESAAELWEDIRRVAATAPSSVKNR